MTSADKGVGLQLSVIFIGQKVKLVQDLLPVTAAAVL